MRLKKAKYGLALIALASVLILTACTYAPNAEVSLPTETFPQNAPAPIAAYVDLTDAFRESRRSPFDENLDKTALTCAKENAGIIIQSEETISISDNQKLKIHCTWNPQDRYVYVGLKNAETGTCYMLPRVGGSVYGSISLSDIPDGEYWVILCSDDNPSVIAVLLYQLA